MRGRGSEVTGRMGTQPGDIEIGWGEESVERSSAVVPAVQADKRWEVLDEYSRARTRFCILSGREGDIRESTASLSLPRSSRARMHCLVRMLKDAVSLASQTHNTDPFVPAILFPSRYCTVPNLILHLIITRTRRLYHYCTHPVIRPCSSTNTQWSY